MTEMDLNDLKLANEMMTKLIEGGADIKAVEFNAYRRKENPSINNRKVLDWLREGGRDFQSISDDEAKEIEDAFIKEVERRFARLNTRSISNLQNTLNSILVSGLKVAMLKLIAIIHDRIENGEVAGGRAVEPLTEKYAKIKMKKHGFIKPIGIATGQLINNLDQDIKNIKVIK